MDRIWGGTTHNKGHIKKWGRISTYGKKHCGRWHGSGIWEPGWHIASPWWLQAYTDPCWHLQPSSQCGFELNQDHSFLAVAICIQRCAYEFNLYLGVIFKFYSKLYFLRFTLPGRTVENGSEQGSYDAGKGSFTIRLPRETPGQHSEGLSMLTALLAQRKSRLATPLV